tara:strand:+ start:123 stop:1442 length:1320 start_codon:yes stop_codon:yes gene_type:complete
MNDINKIKNTTLKNITSINIIAKNIGSKLFKLGIFLLASAPAVSFLLLLFSALLGISNRKDKFLNDKYNWLLILSSFLMIFNCFLITVDFIKIQELDKSLIWIGLLNWLPLFFCYWGFQKYLKTKKDRSDSAKIFIVGSIPVLISGFCQYFLGLYGPYRFFNNLIIWYQRPIGDDGSVSGFFNNYNYAGAWLCIIFPLCLGFLFKNYKEKIFKYINFAIVSSFVIMLVLTTSRSAILAALISYLILEKFSKKKILSIFISIISTIFLFQILILFDLNIQKYITEFLPSGYLNKISSFSLSNIDSLPRFDIWSKSISLINQNLFFGYGAGSFPKIYSMYDGNFVGIQHTHNIFLELTFNHGMPVALIILFTMIIILISASKICLLQNQYQHASSIDKAWIISFTNFLIIHMFDITYFDGRISILCWTLLAGLRSISLNKE